MHQLSLAFRFATVLLILGASPISLPAGWRVPTNEEANQPWRSEDSTGYLAVLADLDGDGSQDEARLLVRRSESELALFVLFGGDNPSPAILLDGPTDVGKLAQMGVAVVPAGRYRTACGKGYWECKSGEPEELTLLRPAVNYFANEGANSFFFWDSATATFQRVWMSD